MTDFKLDRKRADKISQQVIIGELTRVAEILEFKKFSKNDFRKHGKISVGTVVNTFNSWTNAIDNLNEHLINKFYKELKTSNISANRTYTELDLFKEMERIWMILGHRPSRNEWETSLPQISYNTYKHRFKTWTEACKRFIEYKTGELVLPETKTRVKTTLKNSIIKKYKRDINPGLRIKILSRDSFKCIFCGRSPSTHFGLILHVDHKISIAKGGKTEENNLRTLCSDCNLGKSDKDVD